MTNLYLGGAPWSTGALGEGRKTGGAGGAGAGAGAGAESGLGLDWKESMLWWWWWWCKEEAPWWKPIPMPMLESAAISSNIGDGGRQSKP